MSDLIDRQQAIKAVELGITYAKLIDTETGELLEPFKASNDELKRAVQRIKKLPSAQPKRGKWIDRGEHGDWEWQADGRGKHWHEWECNTCHHYFDERTFFCPHCGSDMR